MGVPQLAVLLLQLPSFLTCLSQGLLDCPHLFLEQDVRCLGCAELLSVVLIGLLTFLVALEERIHLLRPNDLWKVSTRLGKSYELKAPRLLESLLAFRGQLTLSSLELPTGDL